MIETKKEDLPATHEQPVEIQYGYRILKNPTFEIHVKFS